MPCLMRLAAEAAGCGYEARLRGLIEPVQAGFVEVARAFTRRAVGDWQVA
ncbi:MAG: hypothetical protein H7Z42_18070 [Roseiflexaceae bacterium]|nr:hypothetical protein [Roseiflexaceae bacterium]